MTMKKTNVKLVLLFATAATCAAISSFAQDASKAPPVPTMSSTANTARAEDAPGGYGLLGSSYLGLSADYYSLRQGPPAIAHGYSLFGRTAAGDNVDTTFDYDWRQADASFGSATRQHVLVGSSTYAVTDFGKPFAEGSVGWQWDRTPSVSSHSSFAFKLATGLEVKIAQGFAMAPYFAFDRATRFNSSQFDYGVRGTYRLTHEWSINARAEYQDLRRSAFDGTEYSLGANYHF
jgi:hypothetical protein